MKKLFFTSVLSLSLLLTACGGPVDDSQTIRVKDGDEVIKIGFVGALTGDAASYGDLTRNTVEDFVEENPVWDGKKVEVISEDGKCNTQDAASAATKLVDVDHVDLIFSGSCSGEGLAIVPIAEKAKVMVFSPINTSPELSGISKYFVRNAPSDALGGQVIAEAAIAEGNEKVALIIENTPFSIAYADQFKKNYTGEIVVEENYNPGNHEFKTVLQKIKDSEATAIIHMNQTPVAAGFLAKQKVELGLDMPTYSTDATPGTDFFEIAKDAAEGHTIVITRPDKTNTAVAQSIENFVEKHGSIEFEAYHILAVDLMNIIKNGVEAVGTDGDLLAEWFRTMPSYDGLTGPIEFDENGDSNIKPSVLVVKDGEFVLKE